jgi:hypothetical protein
VKRALTTAAGLMILAGLVPTAQATQVAVQDNVRHIAHVPGSTGGHVAVEGNRLYVGAYGLGMTIFDVSNPAAPTKIGEYKPVLGGQAGFTPTTADPGLRADTVPDAAVFDGRHIATLSGTGRAAGSQQTEFLDVTNPAAPVLLHRFSGGGGEAHNGDIVDSRRLFLPSGGRGDSLVRIYDLNPLLQSPPAAPARLFNGNINTMWLNSPYRLALGRQAGLNPSHIHDLEVYTDYNLLLLPSEWTDQDGDGDPDPTYEKRDIALYAASQDYPLTVGAGTNPPSSAVYIVDITDPTEPVVINKVMGRTGHRYMHEAQFLQGDPHVLFASDEDLHNGCDAGGVYSWRLSDDLTQATVGDSWFNGTGTPAPVCSAHVFSSQGNYVFMGSYNAGLQVIDFNNFADLKRAGQYIAEGANSWGALAAKGHVYVGDFGGRGLDVFEFIEKPVAKGIVKVNNPGTRTTGGIAETGCRQGDPYGPTNGTDGLIVPIPESASDGKHKLRALGTSEAPYDLDIWFHTDNCTSMGFAGGTDGRDAVETIPEGATMASIDLYTGATQLVYAQIVS